MLVNIKKRELDGRDMKETKLAVKAYFAGTPKEEQYHLVMELIAEANA